MAKKNYRRKAKMTIPIALAAPVAAMGLDIAGKLMKNDIAGIKGTYTGVWEDGKFNYHQIVDTYLPLAAGAAVHIGASKIGVNRHIARAKIPLLRV